MNRRTCGGLGCVSEGAAAPTPGEGVEGQGAELEAVVEGPPEAGGRGEGVHLAEHRHRLLQPGVDVLQAGGDFFAFTTCT